MREFVKDDPIFYTTITAKVTTSYGIKVTAWEYELYDYTRASSHPFGVAITAHHQKQQSVKKTQK